MYEINFERKMADSLEDFATILQVHLYGQGTKSLSTD